MGRERERERERERAHGTRPFYACSATILNDLGLEDSHILNVWSLLCSCIEHDAVATVVARL